MTGLHAFHTELSAKNSDPFGNRLRFNEDV